MEILYIEDDLVDQIAFKRMLRHHKSIDCRMASDLKEAETLLQNFTFDIILSDYYLAGDTIEDVLSKFKDLPIFLLSGNESIKAIEALYENGLKGHFHKPFSKKDLSIILNQEKTNIQSHHHHQHAIADFNQAIVFDFTFLDSLAKRSPSLKKDLIQIFIDLGTSEGLLLQQFLEEANWEMIGRTLHKLKSNLRMMGLKQLLVKANQLEIVCIDAKNMDDVKQDLPPFLNRLEQAVKIARSDFYCY